MRIVGKIDREIYKCIKEDIITDEFIITDVQIKHIQERHPKDCERFSAYFGQIVENRIILLNQKGQIQH